MNRVTGNLFLWLIMQSVSPLNALESAQKRIVIDLSQQLVLILTTPVPLQSLPVEACSQPILQAARDGILETVRELVEQSRSNMDITCAQTGNTALHFAALWGKVRVVEYLLLQGADCHACNVESHTPIHCAAIKVRQLKSQKKNNRHVELADIVRNKVLTLRTLLVHADSLARLGKGLSQEQAMQLYGESGEKLLSSARWSPEIKQVVEKQVQVLPISPTMTTLESKKVQKIPDLHNYIKRFSQSMKVGQ